MLLAGTVVGPLAAPAAADTIPNDDLAYARLLVAAEPVGISFPNALTIEEASDALDAYTS